MLEFKDLKEIDLKLILLSGGSIKVDNLEISPYKLREIRDYGYSNYMKNLQWISLSIDDFIDSIKDENKRKILEEQRANLKTFDFYIKLGGSDFQQALLLALSMVFKTDDIRILDEGVIAIDFVKQGIFIEDKNGKTIVNQNRLDLLSENEIKIVHRDNFDNVIEIIKLQNYMVKPSEKTEKDENPVDEETRALMEHMKKMREKVEEKKRKQREQENGGDIDISDIISAVSSKSNSINKLNIWDLTLYQLYDEYARLEMIDNYDFSIHAMMAGASDVKLTHWSSKL